MDNTIRDQQIDPPEDTRDEREFEVSEQVCVDEFNDEFMLANPESMKKLIYDMASGLGYDIEECGYDPKDSELYCAITNLLELL
jgi:hypothetical protein|tara:strand:+ start:345 stop:596 length:252 start_codon:yes stop_codon:yes gene_type:complete